MPPQYACPCCQYLTLTCTSLSKNTVCEVCGWEDNGQSDRNADEVVGGPNGKLSLTKARANYCLSGDINVEEALREVAKRPGIRAPKPEEIPMGPGGYRHVMVEDVVCPPFVLKPTLSALRQFHSLRGDDTGAPDIVIATFPKCGTTWMQQIILGLLCGEKCGELIKSPMKQSPWPEMACSKGFMSLSEFLTWSPPAELQMSSPTRRVLKTHATVELVPWAGGVPSGITAGAKVIVVCRNPKDTAVSLFHHSRDVPAFEYTDDWAHFLDELFLPGLVESGCFWQWHTSWYKASVANPDNILWISYEELKEDLSLQIERLADFIGVDAPPNVISAVAASASFKSMKATFAEKEAAGEPVKKNHIRKGEAGAWRETFSDEQSKKMDAHHAEKCAELGLDFEFNFG